MANQRPDNATDTIERDLLDLGRRLDWPAERDLLPAVRERLASRPSTRPSRARPPRLPLSPRTALPAAVLVVVALVLTISDATRSTVADRLGLPGISITSQPTTTVPTGEMLAIGEQSTLEEALARTDGTLVGPPVAVLGDPDGVYLLEQDNAVQVTYVYLPDPDLPEAGISGVGLLISQFDGTTNASFIQKQIGPGTTIELTEVNGQRAFWLTGDPHVFAYERPNGDIYQETIRLAANVLLWEQDGKTLRIETTLDRDAAVRIAEAMPTRE